MTAFWKNWLTTWCWAIALVGLLLSTAGLPGISEPVIGLMDLMNGAIPTTVDSNLNFAVGLMGAVTAGWGVTLRILVGVAIQLGDRGKPVWRATTGALLAWYLVDSCISIVTGFWPNAVSNTLILAGWMLPMVRAGLLRGQA